MAMRPLPLARKQTDPGSALILLPILAKLTDSSRPARSYELPIRYPVKNTSTPPTIT